ncbi:unnamed protein product [Penicillium roqueforti FM164]|uniref:Genomic scaffold, ProqFM164S01 n=1 Tax=Penicillium roqueforti (strain FM164) TaxID=1365484 RepID=W6Q5R8_PENRF|nr:unnamed protein product [Penicillium roqueforti FM164]
MRASEGEELSYMTVLVGTYFSIVLKRRGYVSRCTRVSTGQRAMVGVAAVVGLRRRGLHHRLGDGGKTLTLILFAVDLNVAVGYRLF